MSADAPAGPRIPPRYYLYGALVLAVLLRIEYSRELILSPFGRHLMLDAEWYDQAARALREGIALDPGRAYFRPPFYPFFVSALYAVSDGSIWLVRSVQWLLGILNVAICWGIARRTHEDPRVASVTAVLAATYGMFAYFEGEVLTAALGVVTTTGAAWLLLEGDRKPSFVMTFLGGLLLGLAAITHGTALALAPAAAVWTLLGRRRWRATALLTIGVMLPVGGVTARNAIVSGEPVLIASQGGINFYVGNNPQSDGKSALAPGFAEVGQVLQSKDRYRDSVEIAGETLAEREMGRELSQAEISRFWYGKGLAWMRDHPKDATAHLWHKFVFFWSGHEISNNRDFRDQARRFTPILRVFLSQWALVVPFGILGLWATGRGRESRLLVAFLLTYALAITMFFVCSRYRQPAVAWLLPFAAAGGLRVWDRLRAAREAPRGAMTVGLALVALFLCTNGRFLTRTGIADVLAENDAPFHRFNLAVVFEREGNLDRAIEEYRAAASTGIADPRIYLNLGNSLARTGRGEEAREAYRTVMRISPEYSPLVQSNLGVLAAQSGDWQEAVRRFNECVVLDPTHVGGHLGLGLAYFELGRFDDAIVAFRRTLDLPGAPVVQVHRNLAAAYLEAGLPEEALREARAALQLDPEDVASVLTMGRAYLVEGRSEEASRMFRRAEQMAPGVPAVRKAIDEVEGVEDEDS